MNRKIKIQFVSAEVTECLYMTFVFICFVLLVLGLLMAVKAAVSIGFHIAVALLFLLPLIPALHGFILIHRAWANGKLF